MTQPENVSTPATSLEEIQQGWNELKIKVEQSAAERSALEAENKALRLLLDRVIEHRQRSHSDLVNFLVEMVGRLPLNDVGMLVTRLVDHNSEVGETCAAMLKGKAGGEVSKPALLKDLEEKKNALREAVKPAVERLIQLDTPLDTAVLESLVKQPESFFTPDAIRATRCFVKGQVPRERIVRDYGEEALAYFNDLTTDKRFNPRPKPEEIVLGFKDDFDTQLQNDATLAEKTKAGLAALFKKVQASRAATPEGCEQKQAFARLSFLLELLRYYENPRVEAPDAVFAQRLPATVEQLSGADGGEGIDEATLVRIEELLAFIIKPEHRHMVVNNLGKGGGNARTLKHVLTLRTESVVDLEHALAEFVRHLIPTPPQPAPGPDALLPLLKLIPPDMQRLLVGSIMSSDRRRREELTQLGRTLATELGLKGLEEAAKANATLPPETERRMAWEDVKSRIRKRENAGAVAAAIRDRLHTKYDVDEVKESWMALIEADPILFIRIFCQLPYLESGKTDPIAHAVMQVYVGRLLHEKYGTFYQKVVNSLKNMFKANPNSSTLNNFVAMVKWADAEAVNRVTEDVGMPVHA
jgi:hypothetical protein